MSFRPAARQFFERRGATAPALPYDAEVEYLDSEGNTAILTGVNATLSTVISGEFVQRNANSVVGWDTQNCMTNNIQFRWMGLNVSANATTYTRHTFVWGNDCYLDGVMVGTSNRTSFEEKEITLFGRGVIGEGVYDPLNGRIYWIKISDGGILIRDFIPVRFTNELGQSEGAMYDRVSGALFRNVATGAFVVGPDKS